MFRPRYGVSESLSDEFETASSYVYAWFHYLGDARHFAEDKYPVTVWDLEQGIQIK